MRISWRSSRGRERNVVEPFLLGWGAMIEVSVVYVLAAWE